MLHPTRLLAALLLVGSLLLPAAAAGDPPTVFAPLNLPRGVAVGSDGSVFVTSDATTTTLLTKFAPDGTQLNQVTIGDFFSVQAVGTLAIDPATGRLWDLWSDGTLLVIDPNTLEGGSIGSVAEAPIDATDVYDVAVGLRHDLGGTVLPQFSSFGDLALLRSEGGRRLDAFITGRTTGNVLYVMRMTWRDDQFAGARAVIASLAIDPNRGVAPGVAVTPQGTVVTSLPNLGRGGSIVGFTHQAFAFPATYPEAGPDPHVLADGFDLASEGMASDGAGNVFSTDTLGSSLCGADASAAIVVLAPDQSFRGCTEGTLLASGRDVAVTPAGDVAYSTVDEAGVLRWGNPLPPLRPPPPPADTGPAAPTTQDPVALPDLGGGGPKRSRAAIVARRLRAFGRRVRVRLHCVTSGGDSSCVGSIVLKRRGVRWGSGRVLMDEGQTKSVTVLLNRRALRSRWRRARVSVVTRMTQVDGGHRLARRSLVLVR